MQVIKRISQFFKRVSIQIPPLKKKESSYKPATRLQKIRDKDFIYPCSTEKRFIFIANLDGSGFQRKTFPYHPASIPLQNMVNQLNTVCYKQWQANRYHYQRHPFQKMNNISNFTLILAFILTLILQLLVSGNDTDSITNYLFIFLCFIATSFAVCLFVSFSKVPDEDTDALMILCIKNKLDQFNRKQLEASNNNPRFIWTTHKECLWIAMRI